MKTLAHLYAELPIEGKSEPYFWRCEFRVHLPEITRVYECLFFSDNSVLLSNDRGNFFIHKGVKTRRYFSQLLGVEVLRVVDAPSPFLDLWFAGAVVGLEPAYTNAQPRELQQTVWLRTERGIVQSEQFTLGDPEPLIVYHTSALAIVFIVLGVAGMACAICLMQGGRPW